MNKLGRKSVAGIEISLIIIGIFAFGILMGGVGFVNAAPKQEMTKALGFIDVEKGKFAHGALEGVGWAAGGYFAGKLIGPLVGLDDDNTKALSTALAAGAGVGRMANIWGKLGGGQSFMLGLGVAVVVFILMYKEVSTQIVNFECLPWQAPIGGTNCEECNDDELPCSEYRCRSLGQACEFIEQGDESVCVYVNPNDVEPPVIEPEESVLTQGYKYADVKNSPPGPGFKIINANGSDECVRAFTPLRFGIKTNEPSRCKIDFGHTETFDEMAYWFNGNNLYAYNHTEQFSLPGPDNLKDENLTINNDGKWTFFIRCQDKNGNENHAEYAVRFCVDPSPDTTAPQVMATSMTNGGFVAANVDKTTVDFYINEPAECKWDFQDKDYENMDNGMNCSTEVYQMNAMQLYTCRTELNGISRDETTCYIRCKDQPGKEENDRNKNGESYVFSLKGSSKLKMKGLGPNGTIYGGVSPAPVEIVAKTLYGSGEGVAICYYSPTGDDSDYIQFLNTNDIVHSQKLNLVEGSYTYWVKCIDSAGNLAVNSTKFRLNIDANAPVIARIYEEDEMLKIVTVRKSECAYSFDSCDFEIDNEGIEMPYANSTNHVAEWMNDKTYYIKCRDKFRNENADCSVIVKPSKIKM